ncbi:MAG: biopolymer transporter ExbD [Planctomycetes bacterium]|nr:biopolymer transporter ExbD [Planctomycetota bacterium]
MAKIKSQVNEEPADSFTSMIDIVFLLLIFFILQPFKSPEMKLRSELPKDSGPSSSTDNMESIRLEVRTVPGQEDSAYFKISMVRVDDPDRIFRALLNQANNRTDVPVVLDADEAVHFKYVLKALDQCYKAEMRDVKFSAPPPPNAAKHEYMETRRQRDVSR